MVFENSVMEGGVIDGFIQLKCGQPFSWKYMCRMLASHIAEYVIFMRVSVGISIQLTNCPCILDLCLVFVQDFS